MNKKKRKNRKKKKKKSKEKILPLANVKNPTGNDPKRRNKNQQHRPGTNCHKSFQNKRFVDFYSIHCADRSARRIRNQIAVQQNRPNHPIKSKEHRN